MRCEQSLYMLTRFSLTTRDRQNHTDIGLQNFVYVIPTTQVYPYKPRLYAMQDIAA